MQMDSDINRLEHLTTIFRLDTYETIKQFFAQKLRSIKDDEIKLSVLEQNLVSLNAKIERVQKIVDRPALKEAEKDYSDLDRKQQQLVKREFEVMKNVQLLDTLLSTETELDELRSRYTFDDHPQKRQPWLKAQRSIVRKIDAYQELYSAYKKTAASTKKKIADLDLPSIDRTTCETRLQKYEQRSTTVGEEIARLEILNKNRATIEKEIGEIDLELKGRDVDLSEDLDDQIAGARTALKLKQLLSHDHDDSNVRCPTCLSDVDLNNIRSVLAKARRDLPLLLSKQKDQELSRRRNVLKKALNKIEYDPDLLSKLVQELVGLTNKIDVHTEYVNTWKKHAYLTKTLNGIDKPVRPDQVPETELSYDELDTQVELCNSIIKHLEAKSKLIENNEFLAECKTVKTVKTHMKQTDVELSTLKSDLTTVRNLMSKLSATIGEQRGSIKELELYEYELAETQLKIKKLTPSLDDKRVLEVLIKAYGSKGLKTLAANQICSLLESNLNYYRGLVFAESFTFSVNVTDSGMSIIVDRNNGHPPSDVRTLSGAESNCFRLLFIISLLPLVPNDRRLNMLVLDEPTAHCHVTTRNLIYDSYLPALMEVIPNIYVIDNQGDEPPKGAYGWTVIKQDGTSVVKTAY
jgi:hypothetical protein